jgi:hypothetical protein
MGALMFFLLDRDGGQARLDPQPARPIEESRLSWGEGSASAWQSLQRFEQRRQSVQPRG